MTTTNYSLNKPTIGASENTWGGYLNDNFDSLDSLLSGGLPVNGINLATFKVNGVSVTATAAELNYISGVTSGIQTQLDSKASNTGDELSGIYKYADFSELRFGAGEDLRIFHNGANSFITDLGTGNLIISSNGAGVAINTTDNVPMAGFVNGGACSLNYNGAKKFETTATGVDVTGLSINGVATLGTPWNIGANFISIYTDEAFGGVYIWDNGGTGAHYITVDHTTSINNSYYHQFSYQGVTTGSISRSGTTSVAYNTSSDYRLKENIAPVDNAAERVKALKPCRFNFIGEERTVDGFLAHEAQEIVPESVTGDKDAVDADGAPMYQGIDQSKLVPLLTAALQEALARIEALENQG